MQTSIQLATALLRVLSFRLQGSQAVKNTEYITEI